MEKTLLQQIREKELDVATRIDGVKTETDAKIAAAKAEAESLLCTANTEGKKASEEVYWREKGRTEARIVQLKQDAGLIAEAAEQKGRSRVPAAAAAIVRFVTME